MLVESHPFIAAYADGVARPYLPITIINPENQEEINVFALIDTGADGCAFPASFAQPLRHNLQSGRQRQISTGNGITAAYSHTVCIRSFGFVTDNVLIDFMPNLFTPLLGVKSFLGNFILEVDYLNKKFSIR